MDLWVDHLSIYFSSTRREIIPTSEWVGGSDVNEGNLLTSNPFTNKSCKHVFPPLLELHFNNIFSLRSIFVAMHIDENLVKISSCPHSSSQPSSLVTVNMSLPVCLPYWTINSSAQEQICVHYFFCQKPQCIMISQ